MKDQLFTFDLGVKYAFIKDEHFGAIMAFQCVIKYLELAYFAEFPLIKCIKLILRE